MDGYEVAMRLRGHPECSKCLIVAVTGWGHEEDRRRSREMGFDLHLVKPVTAKDLRAMLADLKPKPEEGVPLRGRGRCSSALKCRPGPGDPPRNRHLHDKGRCSVILGRSSSCRWPLPQDERALGGCGL